MTPRRIPGIDRRRWLRLLGATAFLLAGCSRQDPPASRSAGPAGLPILERFLDQKVDMRERADRILAEARSQKAAFIPALLHLMKDRSHGAVVLVPDAAAPFGLRVEDNPFGGDDLRMLDRIAAIVALDELRTPQALPDLLLALDDRDGLPSIHAAEALLHLGNRAGVPVLITALEHAAYESENANRILKRVSGQDLGFDPDAGMTAREAAVGRWRAWWAAFEPTGEKLKGEGVPYRKGQDADADRRIARYAGLAAESSSSFAEQARRMLARLGPPATPFLDAATASSRSTR